MCDEFSGCKAGFAKGINEAGFLAHARSKFRDLHVSNRNQFAEQALGMTRMPSGNDNNRRRKWQPDILPGAFCKRCTGSFCIRHRLAVGMHYRA